MVSLIDVMHGIEEQAFLAFSIKADAINGVVPLSIIGMQPVDVTCPGLEPKVPITNKEHPTKEELQVRVSNQLGFELTVHSSPVKVPAGLILITYKALLLELIADGDVKYWSTRPVSMCELSFQLLDVIGKSWTDLWHVNHSA
jgi:hypothetical protein